MTQFRTAPNGAPILESMLTCPHCGHAKKETMPQDACQFFYECENCKAVLRPNAGDCCVFCSFGSHKCPPMQEQASYGGCGTAPGPG
jgi:hypothetical protein